MVRVADDDFPLPPSFADETVVVTVKEHCMGQLPQSTELPHLEQIVSSSCPSSTQENDKLPPASRLENNPPCDPRIPWVKVGSKARPFVDGGGACSPGRLLPEDRPAPPLAWLAGILLRESVRRGLVGNLQNAARATDSGSDFVNPFPEKDVEKFRALCLERCVP